PRGVTFGDIGTVSNLVNQLGLCHFRPPLGQQSRSSDEKRLPKLTARADGYFASAPWARMRAVAVQRLAWLITVVVALLTALLLLLSGYDGYAGLGVAVAAAAAINLL